MIYRVEYNFDRRHLQYTTNSTEYRSATRWYTEYSTALTDDIYSTACSTDSTEYRSAYRWYTEQSTAFTDDIYSTVQHAVLSTGRQTDDIQSRVQLWQTTFTVRQTVLSTGRHTDDIQSRVLSTGWHTEQSSAEQTTLIVQHFFTSTDWKDNTPSTAYNTEHRLTDWHAESDSAVSCPAGSFKNSNISANLEIVLLIDEDKWALTSRGASHFKKDDKML